MINYSNKNMEYCWNYEFLFPSLYFIYSFSFLGTVLPGYNLSLFDWCLSFKYFVFELQMSSMCLWKNYCLLVSRKALFMCNREGKKPSSTEKKIAFTFPLFSPILKLNNLEGLKKSLLFGK